VYLSLHIAEAVFWGSTVRLTLVEHNPVILKDLNQEWKTPYEKQWTEANGTSYWLYGSGRSFIGRRTRE
jgi:hypothetical protein